MITVRFKFGGRQSIMPFFAGWGRPLDQSEAQRREPKVFLSYASASRDRAGLLANAVRAEGFEVWWDHAVMPGDDYREKTEAALAEADLVIVCWTPAACGSDWVLSEADDARVRDILVPVRLGDCPIPKPFDRIFTSDLTRWLGDRQAPNYLRLIEVLRARAEGREPVAEPWRSRWMTWPNITIAALGALTVLTNISDVKQLIEGFTDPGASQQQVDDLTDKLDLVQAEIMRSRELTLNEELSLRQSLLSLLSAQDGVRRQAAEKAASGDIEGALTLLRNAAEDGEDAVSELAEIWRDIATLSPLERSDQALMAYSRVLQLSPGDALATLSYAELLNRSGRLNEAVQELEYMIALPAHEKDDLLRAIAMSLLGETLNAQGAFDRARDLFTDGLTLTEQIGDAELHGMMLGGLGWALDGLGETNRAKVHYQDALNIAVRSGNTSLQAAMLNNLAGVATEASNYAEAKDLFERAMALHASDANEFARGRVLNNLGVIARLQGNLEESDRRHEEAHDIAEQMNDPIGRAASLSGLGLNAAKRRNFSEAEQRFTTALNLVRAAGARADEAAVLQNLGLVAADQNDFERAEFYGRQALALFRELGSRSDVIEIEQNLRMIGVDPDAP